MTLASNCVLKEYESPSNWQSLKTIRADYAQQIYNKMREGTTMGIDNIIEREREYGNMPYMETGKNHQDFSNIVTSAGLAGCQDQPWCATYQFAMELKEFGKKPMH